MTSATVSPFNLGPTPSARRDLGAEVTIGAAVLGGFAALALGWASVAHLDAALTAPGTIRLSGQRHLIQTVDGGSLAELNVREGQHVRRGQLLVRFAGTAAVAQERALAVRVLGLQAQVARLQALQAGAAGLVEPTAFAALTGADRVEATRAMASARAAFAADRLLDRSEGATLSSQLRQIGDQVGGITTRQSANEEQIALNRDELGQVQSLAAKGYAAKSRVLALQRSAAELDGNVGALQAEAARLRNSANEARLRLVQSQHERADRRAEELRQAQTDLQTALPQWQAARDALARVQLTAPVSGTVLSMTVFSPGAVAAPGQKLMEIVPDDRGMEIDARIPVGSGNDLSPGQHAQVKLTAVHRRDAPVLDGTVTRVSADSLTDEHTGQAYYAATVRVGADALRRALGSDPATNQLRPGTPVSLTVRLYPRTALQYWLEPLTEAFGSAGTEH